jgi:outer membrane protein assembly factor BamA
MEDLNISVSDAVILQGSGINKSFMRNQVLTQQNFNRMKARVLEHLADRGYPFAGVKVDSVRLNNQKLSSRLIIDKNGFITYDTILITGDARVNKSFLHKYLRIRQGDPYRQSDILRIKDRINDLSYLQFKADPRISFVNDKAAFDLPLINRNASRFDFIIGVLPRLENGVRQWTITGDFTGEFVNKLGNGEAFSVRYQRLRPETQELVLDLDYPYIFNLPFGVDGHFELFRNTTEFLDVKAGLGINYNISRKDYLQIGWNFSSSRLIEIDTVNLLQSRKLPQQLDVDVTSGRVAFTMNRFNRLLNPSSGGRLRIDVQAGQKKIIPNLTITSLESGETTFKEAYDTLQLNTFQAQLALEVDYFINVRNWSTIRMANRSAYKYNQQQLFTNEYFRIGGNKLLRGFNEQSIFTPFYSVFTTEFRVLLDELSYISLPFIDYAFFTIG